MVILENIDIDMDICENVDSDRNFLENIDIDEGVLRNIDIDKRIWHIAQGQTEREVRRIVRNGETEKWKDIELSAVCCNILQKYNFVVLPCTVSPVFCCWCA